MHFDWSTLALQTVNILVLLWLLRRFLFRPVAGIIAARRDAAETLLANAATALEQAKAAAAQAALRERALAADGEHVLAEAHAAAETERTKVLEQARQEVAQTRDAALRAVERERTQMRRELEGEARTLGVAIASRLLSRVPSPAVNAALLQSLDAWLSTLPAEQLAMLVPAGAPLEIVTAAPLDGPTRSACTELLNRWLDGRPTLRFATDPSLIAGFELRGPHGAVRNNWRADLDHITQELSRDGEQRALA